MTTNRYQSHDDPILTVWTHHDGGFGGMSPSDEREFIRAIERHGHAVVTDSRYWKPSNHYIIGVGVGHDDAEFCESGRSMAAHYENGEAWGGRWWENTDVFSPTIAYYDPTHPNFEHKTGHQGWAA